jgi:hypothetical protein
MNGSIVVGKAKFVKEKGVEIQMQVFGIRLSNPNSADVRCV